MAPTKAKTSSKTRKSATKHSNKVNQSTTAAGKVSKPRPARGVGGRFLRKVNAAGVNESRASPGRKDRPSAPNTSDSSTSSRHSSKDDSTGPVANGHDTTRVNGATTSQRPSTPPNPPVAIAETSNVGENGDGVSASLTLPAPAAAASSPKPQNKSRKLRRSRHTYSCYPRRTDLDPTEAKRRRATWRERWTAKPLSSGGSLEEQLRAEFFKTTGREPRCYSCKVSSRVMPPPDAKPDGTEERELLLCGCLYEAALLEMWAVKKGLFVDSEIERERVAAAGGSAEHLGPISFGRHNVLFLRFWEMIFGSFDTTVLFNIRASRREALAAFNDAEEMANARLASNPGYVKYLKYEEIGRVRRVRKQKPPKPPEAASNLEIS